MTNSDRTNSATNEKLTDALTLLAIPGVGRVRYHKLVQAFGAPSGVLSAKVSQLTSVPGVSRAVASAIRKEADVEKARAAAARISELGWTVLHVDDAEYPPLLKRTADAPAILFRIGRPVDPDEKMIAIVGTRHATEAGRRFTHSLATKLVEAGLTVVSGMAEGIDSAAHKGALDAGGLTVAVWGTPLNLVYPPSNKKLAATIAERGAIYSEYLPDVQASPVNFPERNRIISGMSEAVVVIEAGQKSGALITAQYALEQGRDLFAVPGAPYSPRSIGCNKLIKEGARLLTDIQDVFDEIPRLGSAIKAGQFKRLVDLTDNERRIVDVLADGPVQIDAISRETGLPVSGLMEYLLALELKGVIEELSGKRFGLAH